MAIISRPLKVATGTINYEDGAGNPVLAAEQNADENVIYGEFNGGIDNDNIAPAAGIVYSKLNLTSSLLDADIHPVANISGTKLAATSIPAGKYGVGSIVLADLQVGLRTQAYASAASGTLQTMSVLDTWTALASPQPTITPPLAASEIQVVTVGQIRNTGGTSGAGDSNFAALWLRHRLNDGSDTFGTPMLFHHWADLVIGSAIRGFVLVSRFTALAALSTVSLQYYRTEQGSLSACETSLNPTVTGAPAGVETITHLFGLWAP